MPSTASGNESRPISAIPTCAPKVLALTGGKAIGLILVLTAMRISWRRRSSRRRQRRRAAPGGQRDQHRLDADRRVPRLRHAGRLRDARGRLRAVARVDQHPRRGHRRHLHLRRHVLGLGLRLHVRDGNGFIGTHGFFLKGWPTPTARRACRCSRSGCSSSRSPTPARRSPRARWSAAAASSATSSTASASPASSTRSSATGPGVRTAGWRSWRCRSATSRDRRSSTPSAAPSRSWAPSRSGRGSAACSARDGGGPLLPHNIILGAVGGLILWFGWYGFNPGSTLSALDAQGIGRVSFNTTMAACSAGLAALFYAYARVGKWDLGLTTNGFLAGLVAITCPCYWVSPTGAFFIGARRRRRRHLGHRRAGIPAHRRSDRRRAGAHGVRHLGHAVARPVRDGRLRRCRRRPAPTPARS